MLEIDPSGAVEHEVRAAELHDLETGFSCRVVRDRPLLGLAMRSELDHRLALAARDAGAELRSPCRLRRVEATSNRVTVVCDEARLESRFVVAADGAGSATARAAGWRPNPHLIPALESELEVPAATLDRFATAARFDFGLIPSGYAWVFPKRGHLSVGCLSLAPRGADLRQLLNEYLHRLEIRPEGRRRDHGAVIPVAPRPGRLARGRVLLTGDAAGLVDPVTCEGISHAILSGRLAATAIGRFADSSGKVAAVYHRSLAASILPELRRARWLARLLYRAPSCRRLVFRRLGQPLCEAMAGIVSGELSYRELTSSPARYLRTAVRLLSRQPARQSR